MTILYTNCWLAAQCWRVLGWNHGTWRQEISIDTLFAEDMHEFGTIKYFFVWSLYTCHICFVWYWCTRWQNISESERCWTMLNCWTGWDPKTLLQTRYFFFGPRISRGCHTKNCCAGAREISKVSWILLFWDSWQTTAFWLLIVKASLLDACIMQLTPRHPC